MDSIFDLMKWASDLRSETMKILWRRETKLLDNRVGNLDAVRSSAGIVVAGMAPWGTWDQQWH